MKKQVEAMKARLDNMEDLDVIENDMKDLRRDYKEAYAEEGVMAHVVTTDDPAPSKPSLSNRGAPARTLKVAEPSSSLTSNRCSSSVPVRPLKAVVFVIPSWTSSDSMTDPSKSTVPFRKATYRAGMVIV